MSERYRLRRALIGGRIADDVLVEVEHGRFTRVELAEYEPAEREPAEPEPAEPGPAEHEPAEHEPAEPEPAEPEPAERTIDGLVIPGLANGHSHLFHRALRGRTHDGGGNFWTWRDQMYALAERLDPDTYHALARAVFAEMLGAGITTVGEFHYLHHPPGGGRYDDPNAMGLAVIAAADEVGVRLTLLDTCYLAAGIGRPPTGVQLRYSDGDAAAWASRVGELAETDRLRIGAALHSVRAVPRDQMAAVADAAAGRPLHVHLSEQVAENEQAWAAWSATPTRLLASEGVLGPMTTVVHATHLAADDLSLLGAARVFACLCPTTERDLGDGVGPSRELAAAGARVTLGSDSHAVIDLFEEMRCVELHERLVTQQRGHWAPSELLHAGTRDGQASLGFDDAGEIAVGRRADLVVLDAASVRTAGTGADLGTVVFAATAADVREVMVDGRWHDVAAGRAEHGRALDEAIGAVIG